MKIVVVGAGAFGTSIAINLSRYYKVVLWCNKEKVNNLSLVNDLIKYRENHKYLPGIKIPENVSFIEHCHLTDFDLLFWAVPCQFTLTTIQSLTINKTTQVVNLSKGMVNGLNINKVLSGFFDNVGTLMGPNIAIDLAKGNFAAGTLFNCPIQFKLYNYHIQRVDEEIDIYGALKNVYAMGYGMLQNINEKAIFFGAVILEMESEGLHPVPNLCGLADLYVTCQAGRNSKAGEMFFNTGIIDENAQGFHCIDFFENLRIPLKIKQILEKKAPISDLMDIAMRYYK